MEFLLFIVPSSCALAAIYFWLKRNGRLHLSGWWAIGFIAITAIATYSAMQNVTRQVFSKYEQLLKAFAPTYANEFSHLGHERVTLKTPASDPTYIKLIDRQIEWLSLNSNVNDIYTFRKMKDNTVVLIVDSETDYDHDGRFEDTREKRTSIGEIYPEANQNLDRAFEGENVFDDVPYSDRWGTWISAYSPIRNSKGEVDAVLGVDYDATAVLAETRAEHRDVIAYGIAFVFIGLFFFLSINLSIHFAEERIKLMTQSKFASLGEMAGKIAHEINNPITIISGRSEMALLNLDTKPMQAEDFRGTFEQIVRVSDRVSKIIKSMKQISRLEQSDNYEEYRLGQLVDECLSLCDSKVKQVGAELTATQTDEARQAMIQCHPSEIGQVIMNLVANAADAIEKLDEKKKINVTTAIESGFAVLRISNNGPTISPEVRQKIMQPFFTTKEVGRGTGLGLSISKTIAQNHGGSLKLLEDTPETTFEIRLPLVHTKQKGGIKTAV